MIILTLIVLAVVVALVWTALRKRYVKKLNRRGWDMIATPTADLLHGLTVPPFGIGVGREAEDLVTGDLDGWLFEVFEYKHRGSNSNRITTVRMPRPLGELRLTNRPPTTAQLAGCQVGPGLFLLAEDPDWLHTAQQALTPALPMIARGGTVNLTVDGDRVVLLDTPAKPKEMEQHIRRAIAAAHALSNPALTPRTWPAPRQGMSFHEFPEWTYQIRDDTVLSQVSLSVDAPGSHNHRAVDVITGANDGLPFVALRHEYRFDPNAQRHEALRHLDRKRMESRSESVIEVELPFHFLPLSVNMRHPQMPQFSLGDPDFERLFVLRGTDERFLNDVFTPELRQWMAHRGQVSFHITNGVWRWAIPQLNPDRLGWYLDYCHGFLGRVPSAVWRELGQIEPPHLRQIA